MPTFSVIIPVYNSASMIEKALLSAINQEGADKEIIVMDAGSTDGTVDIIKKHEADIAFWVSEKDDGPNDAYNKGIVRATGDIISLLNADDWLEPGILAKVSEMFDANPKLDMVTAQAVVWEENPDGTLHQTKHFKGKSQELSPLGSPMPNARFTKKAVFETYGPYLVSNHRGQRMIAVDLEMLLRLSQHSLNNHVLDEVGYNYFAHAASLTFSNNEANERKMYDERAHIAEQYLATPLGATYAARLKRWHRRGTLRLYFWHLSQGNKESAEREKKRGLNVSPIAWRLDYLRMRLSSKSM